MDVEVAQFQFVEVLVLGCFDVALLGQVANVRISELANSVNGGKGNIR